MTRSLQLSINNYPQHQILKLHNLIADYSAQDLVRGKHLAINYQCSMFNEKLLLTANCKLLTATTKGVAA